MLPSPNPSQPGQFPKPLYFAFWKKSQSSSETFLYPLPQVWLTISHFAPTKTWWENKCLPCSPLYCISFFPWVNDQMIKVVLSLHRHFKILITSFFLNTLAFPEYDHFSSLYPSDLIVPVVFPYQHCRIKISVIIEWFYFFPFHFVDISHIWVLRVSNWMF